MERRWGSHVKQFLPNRSSSHQGEAILRRLHTSTIEQTEGQNTSCTRAWDRNDEPSKRTVSADLVEMHGIKFQEEEKGVGAFAYGSESEVIERVFSCVAEVQLESSGCRVIGQGVHRERLDLVFADGAGSSGFKERRGGLSYVITGVTEEESNGV